MKNLRDSANIVRSMARQYQAVIDLAEHVGEGDKLEQDLAHAKERVALELDNWEAAKGKVKYTEDRLNILNTRLSEKQLEMDAVLGAYADKVTAAEAKIKEREETFRVSQQRLEQKLQMLDNAQGQLLDIQGTINERKEELSRLQEKITAVHAAISKVS